MGIIQWVKGLFSRSIADEELPELKALALLQVANENVARIYIFRHRGDKKMLSFPNRKAAIKAGICCEEAAEALRGAQALTGEVQQMSELTYQKMNSYLK